MPSCDNPFAEMPHQTADNFSNDLDIVLARPAMQTGSNSLGCKHWQVSGMSHT